MTLHVYAQTHEHYETHIVGAREDLVRLRAAIDMALGNKARHCESSSFAQFFAADGQGYDLIVKVVPASVEANLMLPYAKSIGRSLGMGGELPSLVPTE
jgi:hypothetical protein